MAEKKVQSQLLVPPMVRDRADALALVTGDTRAEVYRKALEGGGLAALEAQHREALELKLDGPAREFGMTRLELAHRMVADGLTLEAVAGRKRYPRLAAAKA